MSFPFRTDQIRDIVTTSKVLRRPEQLSASEPVPFLKYGDRGKRIDLALDLPDGQSFIDLRFHVHAPVFDNPETFEAALILANQRVRGVGWHATGKKRFYRLAIPRGWHQNVIDPNLPPGHDNYNRHLPLTHFDPIDLAAFFAKTAKLWNLELPLKEGLL
jgi:hypothetical protein